VSNLDHATVARDVASATWGDPVHSCHELIPGVFSVDTSGHGGLIAILATADIPARVVRPARATGRLCNLDAVGRDLGRREGLRGLCAALELPGSVARPRPAWCPEALAVASAHCADFVAAYRHLST
jgi:hypothetical protein